MSEYEGMLLMNAELDEEGVSAIKHRLEGIITGGSGELASWEGWGRKRLASKAKGRTEAVYVLFDFRGDGKIVSELRRVCGLSENVLRCMFLRKH